MLIVIGLLALSHTDAFFGGCHQAFMLFRSLSAKYESSVDWSLPLPQVRKTYLQDILALATPRFKGHS